MQNVVTLGQAVWEYLGSPKHMEIYQKIFGSSCLAVQGHLRSLELRPIDGLPDFLLVINSNHDFWIPVAKLRGKKP